MSKVKEAYCYGKVQYGEFNVEEDRNSFIGGSDIPVILGISSFKKRFQLLLEKAGLEENPFRGNRFTEYGHIMETHVVRFKVFEKKSCENVVLNKCFSVTEQTDRVYIVLTKEDTTIGDVISKPKDYWYEIELNPFTNPQTILGYDEDGAKVFRLYPEGRDMEVFTPEEEPNGSGIDDEFSESSGNPLTNRAVTRAFLRMERLISDMEEVLDTGTDAKRVLFLSRFGCTVDENGFVKWTAQQEAQ